MPHRISMPRVKANKARRQNRRDNRQLSLHSKKSGSEVDVLERPITPDIPEWVQKAWCKARLEAKLRRLFGDDHE